jgi:hypothetical protein
MAQGVEMEEKLNEVTPKISLQVNISNIFKFI